MKNTARQETCSISHPPSTGPMPVVIPLCGLGDVTQRDQQDKKRNRQIDEKHRAPGNVFDQPSTEHWPDAGGDRAESRPCSDRAAAFLFGERAADDRETARNEQRGAKSLKRARRN